MRPSSEPNPLWIEHSRIPWGSAGWRMGHGEVYWNRWFSWWKASTSSEKSSYQERWPEPKGWEGFYAYLTTGEEPPRFQEERRKMNEAAFPPRPEENEITERYRVKWLATSYFRRPKVFVRDPRERGRCELMADPDGWLWKLHLPDSTDELKVPYFTRQITEVIGTDNLPVRQPVA